MSAGGRADLEARLRGEGLAATVWSNGPGDTYTAHRHDYDKVLVVAEGSIVFGLVGPGSSVELRRGDRLDLPSGVEHDACVGPEGVVCLEAHLASGTLARQPRARGSDW